MSGWGVSQWLGHEGICRVVGVQVYELAALVALVGGDALLGVRG